MSKSKRVFTGVTFLTVAAAALAAAGYLWHDARSRTDRGGRPDLFAAYQFKDLIDLPTTSVKVQGASGTCWSFAGTSFLESECLRTTGQAPDLSEMFAVRSAYQEKARNFILRQGTARFTEGGLIHDVLISAAAHGLVSESSYSGLTPGRTVHDHREMIEALEPVVKRYASPSNRVGNGWRSEVDAVLDAHLGAPPADLGGVGGGGGGRPGAALATGGVKPNFHPRDYVTITSFAHAPFYHPFVLEIPANFASERFYNLPLDEFIENLEAALQRGFTVALDADVSEPYFGNGVAVLPRDGTPDGDVASGRFEELHATQEARQVEFECFRTTDDHLMHIVGTARDGFGRTYFKTKNCWGTQWGRDGFCYLSKAYLRMKAISVTLHQNGLTDSTRSALGFR